MEAGNDAAASALPQDWAAGTFIGRMATSDGPSPILIVRGELYDMARVAPTVSALADLGDFSGAGGEPLGPSTVAMRPRNVPVAQSSGNADAAAPLPASMTPSARLCL